MTIMLKSIGILAKLCHAHMHLYCPGETPQDVFLASLVTPSPNSMRIHHTCQGDWLFSRCWCTQLDLKLTRESDNLLSIGGQTFLKPRVRGPEGLSGSDELWVRPVYGIACFLHGPGYHHCLRAALERRSQMGLLLPLFSNH